MAWNVKYADFGLTTGNDDGTTEANAWQTPASMISGVTAGDRVEMRQNPSTPYTHTTSLSTSKSGTAASPIWFRGYTNTPGDGGVCHIQWQTGGVANFVVNGDYQIWENFSVTPVPNQGNLCSITLGGASVHRNVTLSGSSMSVAGTCFRSVYRIADVSANGSISLSGTNGFSFAAHECVFALEKPTTTITYFITNDTFGRHTTFSNCLIINRTNASVDGLWFDRYNSSRGCTITGNIFYGFDNGIIFDEASSALSQLGRINGNLFSEMGAYAVNATNTPAGYITIDNNWYYNCTSGFSNFGDYARWNTSLSADPFQDASNEDFRINNTSGGGAVIRSTSGIVDILENEPFEIDSLGGFWEPVGGSTPSTHTYFG